MNETNETGESIEDTPKGASLFEKAMLGGGILFTSVAAASAAGAQDAASVTAFAETGATELSPVVLGVGGALVGIAVLRFGVRWVLSAIGRGGKA